MVWCGLHIILGCWWCYKLADLCINYRRKNPTLLMTNSGVKLGREQAIDFPLDVLFSLEIITRILCSRPSLVIISFQTKDS